MKEAATDASGKKSKKNKSKSEVAENGEPMHVDKAAATNGDASEEPKSEKKKKKKNEKRKLDKEPSRNLNVVNRIDAREDGPEKKKKTKKKSKGERRKAKMMRSKIPF